jgi:hypothetical protein
MEGSNFKMGGFGESFATLGFNVAVRSFGFCAKFPGFALNYMSGGLETVIFTGKMQPKSSKP